MDKTIFYAPNITSDNTLPAEESAHCIRVLRKKEGDKILVTDGRGYFFDAEIIEANQKKCIVQLVETIHHPNSWTSYLQIAFAPTKNMDRVEWFSEKATEIGINRLSPIFCKHSERRELKNIRIEKILVSAMKQSQKAVLPILDELAPFAKFIEQPFKGQKFIAHCYDTSTEKPLLKDLYKKGEDVLILIGPEGDFSENEVEAAIIKGFQPISLGESRLRTETAALVACNTIQIINQ